MIRLRRLLRSKLRHAEKLEAFFELFAGAGRVGKRITHVSGYPVLYFDTLHDDIFDLTDPPVLQLVGGWIPSGVIRGLIAGFPCTSWSHARWPAVRSIDYFFGLSDLPAHAQQLVENGNATLNSTLTIIDKCCLAGVPIIVENPVNSPAWTVPRMRTLASLASQVCHVDYCGYGARWRERTKFICWKEQ